MFREDPNDLTERKLQNLMNGIKAYWLGIPIIERNGNVIYLETRKATALLAYLGLSSPLPSSRESLATLFWPKYDQQHAQANLRRALYSINHALGPELLASNRDNVGINPSCLLWQDVTEFRLHMTNVKLHNHDIPVCTECINALEKATALYRGIYLEGLNLKDCTEFDIWQYMQRENFLQDMASSLEKLVHAYASLGEWDKAIQRARQWVSLDRLNEKAQRMLIKAYAQSGQLSAALNQFAECSQVLNEELGQSPDDETTALYQEIRTGELRKKDALPMVSTHHPQGDLIKQPLIKTKLFIPRLRAGLVPRPHLLEKLEQGSDKLLTLISAPAGYGKTTLLTEWIDTMQTAGPSAPWAICWFSLDPGDNDPIRFLVYLTAALEKVHLGVSAETQQVIRSSESLHPTTPLTMLVNDLQRLDQSVLLVLDDYQFISNPAIHDGITFLIEHMPDNVHVVIATRSDPPIILYRLRARNQLSEIRADDLRFTSSEITMFLNQVFKLNLTEEQIHTLETRTEGWIAGLQLAGVSMQGRLDIPQFIEAFSGSHRFIMDYLAEEALSRQPIEIQKFLLQTSILERLSDSLCNFILTGESEYRKPLLQIPIDYSIKSNDFQSQLSNLESLGLFIVPQDDERVWYRYHHLFADLLRTRFESVSPELIPILHRRASTWFEKNGDIEDSINHSLAAEDWDNASRLIDLRIHRFLENGQMTTVMKWIGSFPREELFKKPKLCIQVAEMYSQAGMIDQIDPLLDKAEEIVNSMKNEEEIPDVAEGLYLSEKEITVIQSMASILRGLKAVCSGHPQRAIDITQAALDTIPDMETKELAVLFWVQGWAHRSLGNLNLALDLLIKGTEYASASGAILRDIWTDLGNVTRLVGKLPRAIKILTDSLQTAIERGIQNQGNLSRDESLLSILYYEQNQLDQAFIYASRALAHTHWWPSHNVIATANVSLAQILLARNDLDGCICAIQKAEDARKNRLMTPYVHCLVDITWAQIWLKQAKWDLLNQWECDQTSILKSKFDKSDWIDEYLEMRLIMLVRVWIEKTKLDRNLERLEECLQLLDRLEKSSRTSGRVNSLTVILLYKAIVYFAQERRDESIKSLDNCFSLAESGGYVRILLDAGESAYTLIHTYLQKANPIHKLYATMIIKAFKGMPIAQELKKGLMESLTSREMDILRLLTEGCSNRQMADRLVLSEGTIKFHVHNLLGKLHVTSRTQAIAKAKELDLV
jgi:LuxR family maltose regulon positive regulatory protein